LDTLAGVVKSITPADPVPVPPQAAQEGLAWRWDESESEGVTRLREVSGRPLGFGFTFPRISGSIFVLMAGFERDRSPFSVGDELFRRSCLFIRPCSAFALRSLVSSLES
jgi:hypothetical protein